MEVILLLVCQYDDTCKITPVLILVFMEVILLLI